MKNEIKRNNWSRFFKRFNSANQFRRTKLNVRHTGDRSDTVSMSPFLGLALAKKGRLIEGVQFLNGGWDANNVAHPAVTIKDPSQVWLVKDQEDRDHQLHVRSKDGTEAWLELDGEPQSDQEKKLVEKVAYSMFEHRGHRHGNDMGDWYEAEQRVRQTELELTK